MIAPTPQPSSYSLGPMLREGSSFTSTCEPPLEFSHRQARALRPEGCFSLRSLTRARGAFPTLSGQESCTQGKAAVLLCGALPDRRSRRSLPKTWRSQTECVLVERLASLFCQSQEHFGPSFGFVFFGLFACGGRICVDFVRVRFRGCFNLWWSTFEV